MISRKSSFWCVARPPVRTTLILPQGEGGYGQVVKARHKLEKRFYAIKKVRLLPSDNVEKVLREVQSLSNINHVRIVRYVLCLPCLSPPDTRQLHPMLARGNRQY